MSYRVKLQRVDDDHFALVYGRGRCKLTATLTREGRGWKFAGGDGSAALCELGVTTLQRLKARWAEWIATAPTVEDPVPDLSLAAAQLENDAPNTFAGDDDDDRDPVNTFEPRNDFERGLLAAAKFVNDVESYKLTRGRMAERILQIERLSVEASNARALAALGAVTQAVREFAHV